MFSGRFNRNLNLRIFGSDIIYLSGGLVKKTLEQQLTDKCQELKIDYEISEDAVWVQIKTHHLFKTNGETWEHCRILDESEAWLEQRQEKKPEKKYNLQTETNIAIRIILKAI